MNPPVALLRAPVSRNGFGWAHRVVLASHTPVCMRRWSRLNPLWLWGKMGPGAMRASAAARRLTHF
jgi:hypothetical protein